MSLNIAVAAAAAVAAIALSPSARADDHAARVPLLPAYEQECASCHVAFPPGLLPAASWQRVMRTLPAHYGTDASVDPGVAVSLSAWLTAHAGTGKRARDEPPQDRISRSEWFVREHREVRADVWTRPAIKSAAHCAACHTQADQGDFSEHRIRIPR